MINYKQAGQRLRKQRKRLGFTQEAISEKIKITPSFYSQIETGVRKAGINTFVKLSKELSVSLDYILGNTADIPSSENLDDTEYKIFHHLKNFSPREKELVLNIITSLEKYNDL